MRRINIGFVRMENSVLRTFMVENRMSVLDIVDAEDVIPDELPVDRSFELVVDVNRESVVDEAGGTMVVNSVNFVSLTEKGEEDVPYPEDIGVMVASAFTQLLAEKLYDFENTDWLLGSGSFSIGGI